MAGVAVRNESPRFRQERSAVCSVRGRSLRGWRSGTTATASDRG
jgi:hypothetical protein